MRVDLAEVEAALGQHPRVAAAATKLWHLPAGPVLAAYVQLAAQQADDGSAPGSPRRQPAISTSELKQWCQEQLPAASVPQHVLVLPRLPRSAAGKVQQSQLPHPLEAGTGAAAAAAAAAGPAQSGSAGSSDVPPSKRPRSSTAAPGTAASVLPPPAAAAKPISELAVSHAFAAALGHSDFEATTNLFSIGGNSLMAAHIAGEVAGGDVEAVFSHPTVRSLAAFLSSGPAVVEAGGAAAAAAAGGSRSSSQGAEQQQQQQDVLEATLLGARRLDVSNSTQPAEDRKSVV